MAFWFELDLGSGVSLSTSPHFEREEMEEEGAEEEEEEEGGRGERGAARSPPARARRASSGPGWASLASPRWRSRGSGGSC